DDREQCVRVRTSMSPRAAVISGVPQGSALDLLSLLFADDLKLWSALNQLWGWSEIWELPINWEKCSVLQVGPKLHATSHQLGTINIPSISQIKELSFSLSVDFKAKNFFKYKPLDLNAFKTTKEILSGRYVQIFEWYCK
uniref:Reverse transcriptase domain-containing protein n=1 Tax=Electrophorus electricus TaxID=8005 RepID=A0A4W4GM69_ELEEL